MTNDDFALTDRPAPLTPVIRAAIEAAGGAITFTRFMAIALGHPEHGYYSRPDLAWGRDGDYETSPEVHPIFGYLWARQVEECWERLDRPADLVPGERGGLGHLVGDQHPTLAADGPVRVRDCACVETSFPGFERLARGAGLRIGRGAC